MAANVDTQRSAVWQESSLRWIGAPCRPCRTRHRMDIS